ncbi:MAG: arginine repressor [Ruminococcaceae bacterium]|nr:arginine repressor [Oscillospiraceae bacterium]
MKRIRQEKLLELISKYEIDTQDELIERLRESGFEVTQATVSRDIRELNISKMTTGKGTYRYVLPKQTAPTSNMKFNSALIDALIHIDYACNIVVLKTHAGLANALAVGIDAMHLENILGCVAGDDTILLVSRSEEAARKIVDRFRGMIK